MWTPGHERAAEHLRDVLRARDEADDGVEEGDDGEEDSGEDDGWVGELVRWMKRNPPSRGVKPSSAKRSRLRKPENTRTYNKRPPR